MYANKTILAPMVRIGTLPTRLLALQYGADLVYTEELIDWKLLRSTRRQNEALGTVDYVDPTDGTVVFRTCAIEKDKVILQIGTCDPDRAAAVANLMEEDVAGFDVNMGCPKEFSLKGGMGAALLSDPDKAKLILRRLVGATRKPVTCKIRVFDDPIKTVQFCRELESCGIAAVAVHGRTVKERQQHPNRNELLKLISKELRIPVIANGGSKSIESHSDIEVFRESTGCSSVMVARAAEWNASVFRPEGKLPLDTVIKEYLKLAVEYDNPPANTKYCVQNMLRELQESELGKRFLQTQTLFQICDIWGLGDYCTEMSLKQRTRGALTRRDVCPLGYKNTRLTDPSHVEMEAAFIRGLYPRDPDLPKSKLLSWCLVNGSKIPKYKTEQLHKLFKSTVTVNGKQYSSSFWEKSKRWAEQGAAIVCLVSIGVLSETAMRANGVLK